MPAPTPRARRFFGAEIGRKERGEKTVTGLSREELGKMASKPGHNTPGDGTGMDAESIPTKQGNDITGEAPRMPRGGGFQLYD